MTTSKRLSDLAVALVLAVFLLPLILGIALLILFRDGWPVLYISERMKTVDEPFALWKFRSMTPAAENNGVSGGDKASRITPTGQFLRKYRLDELPQLFNILRGDISFVGPRPPLRRYVELRPDLYSEVLKNRPGVTGLATLVYHQTEERLLAQSTSPEETEAVYLRRCVPAKARLDLIWARNRSLCLDWILMAKTLFRGLEIPRRQR